MAKRTATSDESKVVDQGINPEQAPRVYSFVLNGITPLLMHADDVEQGDRLDAWRKDPGNKGVSKAGDDRSPPWSWKTYCYTDGEHLAIPADNLMAAMRYAGAQLILKKQKTFKSATQCGLVIQDLFCAIQVPTLDADGQVTGWHKIKTADVEGIEGPFVEHVNRAKQLGFKLFIKRAPVGASKHVRVRPRFEQWRVEGVIEVAMPEFTEDVLVKLFTIAGNYAGLCDWRPSSPKSPGPFGRFVAQLREVKQTTAQAA